MVDFFVELIFLDSVSEVARTSRVTSKAAGLCGMGHAAMAMAGHGAPLLRNNPYSGGVLGGALKSNAMLSL